jgi:hypothetical protein
MSVSSGRVRGADPVSMGRSGHASHGGGPTTSTLGAQTGCRSVAWVLTPRDEVVARNDNYCLLMTDSNRHSKDQPEMLGARAADSTQKDPAEWVTGDEPMTGAQRSYLDTLAREAGEEIPADLTKAEASEHIERLQAASDRVG